MGSYGGGAQGGGTPYQTFGGRLAGTLSNESGALNGLYNYLSTQRGLTSAQIQQAIGNYRATVQSFLPSYGQEDTDPFHISDLPGATGSAHEGGITANFGPRIGQLNELIASLRGGSSGTTPSGSAAVPAISTAAPPTVTGLGTGLTPSTAATPELPQSAPSSSLDDPERARRRSQGLAV